LASIAKRNLEIILITGQFLETKHSTLTACDFQNNSEGRMTEVMAPVSVQGIEEKAPSCHGAFGEIQRFIAD